MSSPSFDGDDEKRLDPAVLRIQTRLRRLMLIAGLTLGLGIFAVFAAILYRIVTWDTSKATPSAVTAVSLSALGLAADAKLLSTALDGNRLALTYGTEAGTQTVVVDVRTGAVVQALRIDAK